jgi:hypothetical protein
MGRTKYQPRLRFGPHYNSPMAERDIRDVLLQRSDLSSFLVRRQIRLSPFGLAFSKMRAREKSANPVWYIDITPGHDFLVSEPKVQASEVPARVAAAGMPAGRVPATKVAASGVAASASVLRFWGAEETGHGSRIGRMRGGRTRRSIRVAMASPTQGMWFQFTPGRGRAC